MRHGTLGRRLLSRGAASLVVGAAVLGGLALNGAVRSEQDLLVFVGFDPDRSTLITALSIGAVAAFGSALATGQRRIPALLSLVTLAALFGPTLMTETQAALRAHGDQGAFDLGGWMLSVVGLVGGGTVVGWAAVTLAAPARAALLASARDTRARIRSDGPRGLANGRLAATLATIAVVALSANVVANMIDYSPASLFHVGDPGVVGLAPGGPGATPGSATQGGSTASAIDFYDLPAPWVGGTSNKAQISVYLPAGYANVSTRYPVVYAVPWAFAYWEQGIHVQEILDGLIARKEVPPTLVVFTAVSSGGPYPDTECADSADGMEHIETYLATTVPAWVDSHYRTLADADHRTVFGFSQGGFCSTMLVLRHTDVFHYAVSFGGYYQAGVQSAETVNAGRPWAGDPQLIADHSPMLLASATPPDVRPQLFMVLSGTASQPFYGAQYSAFVDELATDGIPAKTIDTPAAHSWPSVQADLPLALQDVAATQRERVHAVARSASP